MGVCVGVMVGVPVAVAVAVGVLVSVAVAVDVEVNGGGSAETRPVFMVDEDVKLARRVNTQAKRIKVITDRPIDLEIQISLPSLELAPFLLIGDFLLSDNFAYL